eukprot:11035697-Alexandrium_andersonii.AAC.1
MAAGARPFGELPVGSPHSWSWPLTCHRAVCPAARLRAFPVRHLAGVGVGQAPLAGFDDAPCGASLVDKTLSHAHARTHAHVH